MRATFDTHNKDFISKGLVALNDACEEGYDSHSLDLSEFDRDEKKAFSEFTKTVKKGAAFDTVKLKFKDFCLGDKPCAEPPEKKRHVEKVLPKKGTSNKVLKKAKHDDTPDPIMHDGVGDIEVNIKDGEVTLFDHPLMSFKHELLKRQECYEIVFKWCTVKGHKLTDKVLLPHKRAPTEQALKLLIGKIARRLVLVYLSPYGAMDHPADSQGIINEVRDY